MGNYMSVGFTAILAGAAMGAAYAIGIQDGTPKTMKECKCQELVKKWKKKDKGIMGGDWNAWRMPLIIMMAVAGFFLMFGNMFSRLFGGFGGGMGGGFGGGGFGGY